MSVRYLSAERTIAAAGAAFACPDDDFSVKRYVGRKHAGFGLRFKRMAKKLLIACGLIIA
jgi:hypothetical protein